MYAILNLSIIIYLYVLINVHQIDYIGFQDITDESSASRSYDKIKENYTPSSHEKAKEWFQMQQEWMDNIKTNQNYFDDQL